MQGFSQNIYGTLAEDLRPLKGQENLHGTGYDKRKSKKKKKRERERKESEWNLWPWEGAVKEESFLPAGKSARWRGDQSGQRGRFRALDYPPDLDRTVDSPALSGRGSRPSGRTSG